MNRTWTLSDDRRKMVITDQTPQGTRTITLKWDHPATEDNVARALDDRTWVPMEVGEKRTAWRKEVGSHTFWLHRMSGPPTWWFPRLFLTKDKALVFGWLRLGFAVAIRPTKKET